MNNFLDLFQKVDTRVCSQIIRNPDVMKDFPAEFLRRVAADPDYPNQGPWRITLEPYVVSTFLGRNLCNFPLFKYYFRIGSLVIYFTEYCPDTSLRKFIWRAKVLRCSLYGEQQFQTSTALENIRSSRNELARAIGYKSFAHMSMETKMAGSLENIYNVFDTLLEAGKF